MCQEDQEDQLRGSQSCREPHRLIVSPLCQLLLFPFLSSESLLGVTHSLVWEAAPWPGRSSAGWMGLGWSLPQGRLSPSCWFAGRAFPCIPHHGLAASGSPTPTLPAVFLAGQGGKEGGCAFQLLLACLLSLILACLDRIPLCSAPSDRGRRKS